MWEVRGRWVNAVFSPEIHTYSPQHPSALPKLDFLPFAIEERSFLDSRKVLIHMTRRRAIGQARKCQKATGTHDRFG